MDHITASPTIPVKLVSFDVFDTLLTRKVTSPHSVFYFTALSAIEEGLINCSAETYVKLRREAETVTRTGQPDWQTDDKRIFAFLSKLLVVSPETGNRLRTLEIEWERKMLVPIPGAAQMLDKERISGHKVAFVSDMYWSSSVIKMFLTDANFFREGDQLLVSAENGASKDTGRLFEKLIADNPPITNSQIRHHGNDEYIDYKGALKAGLKGVLLTKCNPTEYEVLLESHREETDGLACLLSGTGRLLRLNYTHLSGHTAEMARIIGNVVGPSMVTYVLWILKEAKNKGLKQLCFVSRDGYVPYLVCNRISKMMGFDIKAFYMYGSRQSWHIPGLHQFDDSSFSWMLENFKGATVETIFKRVDMTWDAMMQQAPEVSTLFTSPNAPVTPEVQVKIRNLIETNTRLKEYILDNARAKREVLLEYLQQEGIEFREKTGMVEIGWAGRTRTSFERIIGGEQSKNLHWFYFGLLPNLRLHDPERISTFLHGPDLTYKSINGLPIIIESFCFAPHGSVVGFERRGEKIVALFNNVGEEELDKWGRSKYFVILDRFCDLLPLDMMQSIKFYNLRNPAYNLLKSFVESPSRQDAEVWGSIPFIHDQFGKTSTILAPKTPINVKTIKEALTFGQFNLMANGGVLGVWGAGSWAKRDWTMFPLYLFTFAGHMRVKGRGEFGRVYRETKLYIKRILTLK
jgi:FMN phosphatase YigB (HAD superfamily)